MKLSLQVEPSMDATIHELMSCIHNKGKIGLSQDAEQRIIRCRNYLDNRMKDNDSALYGINTGFGSLCNTVIPPGQLESLQKNLLLSHACGAGNEVPSDIVRLMLLLKIRSLCYGHSGVQLTTVQRLCDFYNHDILPVIYEQGSLGASGDLAPLAHLSLPLIGEGEVIVDDQSMSASQALKNINLSPVQLQSKEGLALINGTQFMNAYAAWCVHRGLELLERSVLIACISIDAYNARPEPFDPLTHKVRKQSGQGRIATLIAESLSDSKIFSGQKGQVQDPYSFRCIPQVLGASLQTIESIRTIIENEINSVTDNPLIFPEENKIISGGNFHGQPLAIALDLLSIALAEIASISERRIYKLIGGHQGLPAFLAKNPGLHSGFMIPQYTAASIVSQNKQLCTPACVDTIDSSNGQEDHVSMGANSATKCYRVVQNLEQVLAIEMMTAAQALEFRRPQKSSSVIEGCINDIRQEIPFLEADQYLHPLMKKSISVMNNLRPLPLR